MKLPVNQYIDLINLGASDFLAKRLLLKEAVSKIINIAYMYGSNLQERNVRKHLKLEIERRKTLTKQNA